MAEARLAQRHERALLDPAAEVSGLGVPHDLTWVADGLEIAGDEFVERRSFRAGNLDDSVSRRGERHLGDNRSNVVRRDGLNSPGERLTMFPSVPESAMPPRNSRNWLARMMV